MIINIRESLLALDKKTSCRYDLTSLYESCRLDEKEKEELVKYIASKEPPFMIGQFLSDKCGICESVSEDDDVTEADMKKIIDDVNEGEDHTLWALMDKADEEDKKLKEEVNYRNNVSNAKEVATYVYNKIKDDDNLTGDDSRYWDFERCVRDGDDAVIVSEAPAEARYQFSLVNDTVDIDIYMGREYQDTWYVVDHKSPVAEDVEPLDTNSIDELDECGNSDNLEDSDATALEEGYEVFTDVNGIMGEPGETYTPEELEAIWEQGKDSDPSMVAYEGNFDAWYSDTTSQMEHEVLEEGVFRDLKHIGREVGKQLGKTEIGKAVKKTAKDIKKKIDKTISNNPKLKAIRKAVRETDTYKHIKNSMEGKKLMNGVLDAYNEKDLKKAIAAYEKSYKSGKIDKNVAGELLYNIRKRKKELGIKESLFEDYDVVKMNDKYFPRIDISDTARYDYVKHGGRDFAYDKKDNILHYLFKDEEEIDVMGGIENVPFRSLDAAGLSLDSWTDTDVRDEYLDGYANDLDDEASYLAQDFIKNELPYLQQQGLVDSLDAEEIEEAVATAEKDLTSIDGTIASVLNKHKDEINQCHTDQELKTCVIRILNSGECKDESAAEDAIRYLSRLRGGALSSTVATYMIGGQNVINPAKDARKRKLTASLDKELTEGAPSQATLDDCLQDYKQNAFGFDGVEDYVETQFPMHDAEFKKAVIDYLKGKNESLNESWSEDVEEAAENSDEDFMDDLYQDFYSLAYKLVEKKGFTNVSTEPSTQLGQGADFFWAEKDGVSYEGQYDFESEQDAFWSAAKSAKTRAQAIKNCAKVYADIILSSLQSEEEYAAEDTLRDEDETSSASKESFYIVDGDHLIIKDGVTEILEKSIREDSIRTLTIPSSVTSIEEGAFTFCDSLTDITVDKNNTAYSSQDGVLFNKSMTTLVSYPRGKTTTPYKIPDSVTSIEQGAFNYCYDLTSVTIPNSVTSIGKFAFWCCKNLVEVNIGNSVKSIADGAFWGCNGLTSVSIPNSVTSFEETAFDQCYNLDDKTTQRINELKNKNNSANESKSIKESDEEKPYTYRQVFDELKLETKNFTIKGDTIQYYYKSEAEHAVKILSRHYAFAELDKAGSWFQIEFDDPKKSVKKEELKEAIATHIYLFPELTDEDMDGLKAYGLQYLGKNHGADGSEDNWVVAGDADSIRRYAEKWLGYALHPDYLYDADDFAGEIVEA